MCEILIYAILSTTPVDVSVTAPHIRIGGFESREDAQAKRETLWFSAGAAFVTDIECVPTDGTG